MTGLDDKAGELPHYLGHRERLKARFREAGDDALPDYELLELILFQVIRQADTKPMAKALLARFGTFAEVLAAPEALLTEVDGVGPAVAHHLKVTQAAARRYAKVTLRQRPVLDSWKAVVDYCHAAMAYEHVERFRILFLDRKNTLIADEVQQSGTIDHTPVYPREVVKRALELSATALILAHNHPTSPFSVTIDHARYG